jgi:hypothetical protein
MVLTYIHHHLSYFKIMSKDKKPKKAASEEFQRFEDVASKIFQVPIKEVRELEAKKSEER